MYAYQIGGFDCGKKLRRTSWVNSNAFWKCERKGLWTKYDGSPVEDRYLGELLTCDDWTEQTRREIVLIRYLVEHTNTDGTKWYDITKWESRPCEIGEQFISGVVIKEFGRKVVQL